MSKSQKDQDERAKKLETLRAMRDRCAADGREILAARTVSARAYDIAVKNNHDQLQQINERIAELE